MKRARKLRKYYGFTMTEMLITMGVLVLLFAIIVSSFGGMRDSVVLTDIINTFIQDVRYAQRSSLFLTRQSQERWIYGIGIDLGGLSDNMVTNENGYKLFKWCSPFNDFDSNGDIRMRSEVPAYDPSYELDHLLKNGKRNAGLVTNYREDLDFCPKCSGVLCNNEEYLIPIKGYGLNEISPSVEVEFLDVNGKELTSNLPRFILFESVTGRAFFYDFKGKLLNYYKNSEELFSGVSSSIPAKNIILRIKIGEDQSKVIEIKAVSGIVNIIKK